MTEPTTLKQMLLSASESQLGPAMFPLIQKWDEAPTSLHILEVLDKCIYASLASGFVVGMLQSLYDIALSNEGKTHEQNEQLAVWRKELV